MSILNIGPDGFFLIEASILSVLIAVLAWRRVGTAAGIAATAVAVIAFVTFNATSLNTTPGLNYRIVTALFIIVPSALLLSASRVTWVSKHAWVVVLLGPLLFVGCYAGICELCLKTGVI